MVWAKINKFNVVFFSKSYYRCEFCPFFYFTDDIEQYTPGIPKNPNWNITENNLGPFVYSDNELKEFLNYVEKFEINYKFNTYVPFYYKQHLECFGWKIKQNYDFSLKDRDILDDDGKPVNVDWYYLNIKKMDIQRITRRRSFLMYQSFHLKFHIKKDI